jgi:Na+-driven multidrug efflux pump
VGIIWVAFLGLLGGTLTILLRKPIAAGLLGSPDYATLVLWAGVLGGVGAIFKLCDIVIWFEKRPLTFVIVDALRPTLNLILMAYWIRQGDGVEGAIRGAAIGTSIATVFSVLALARSFKLAWSWHELKLILLRGLGRVPVQRCLRRIQGVRPRARRIIVGRVARPRR